MHGAAAATDPAFSAQRRAMVDGQIRTFAVTDAAVIAAFSVVPRELFLPDALRSLAYSDAPLTLDGSGRDRRVLMQPMLLARLMQGAAIEPTARALVVAGGNGYAAALLARIAASVVTLDTDPDWAAAAEAHARSLGLPVRAVTGPLADGCPDGAPYDVILVQGAVETGLDPLLAQLAPDGRLVAIETRSTEATRRNGKALSFQRIAGDTSVRALFDATVPVLPAFRRAETFVF